MHLYGLTPCLLIGIYCLNGPFLQVKKALYTLIQQNLVTFSMNKRGFVEYSLDTSALLMRLHFPRIIYVTKLLYEDSGELLMEEMAQHGQIQMSRLVYKVTEKLNQAFKGI